ncbi:chemotaxis protein CheD [Candidatus Hydrogenedentota bacterium]
MSSPLEKRNVVVDISAIEVSNDPGDTLITYSLGSCLGIVAVDAEAGIAGMAHCMLPLSKVDPTKAAVKPGMFIDTGVPRLLQMVYNLGADKGRLEIKVAGGAQLLDQKGLFRIGERNFTVLRKLLWKNNLLIKTKDIGGEVSRTLSVDVATGKVSLKIKGNVTVL